MTEVRVITFDGRKTAAKALDTIEDEGGYLWLDDVAVVSRSKRGVIRVHSTWAQDDTGVALSAGGGALTGALIGAMMGPQGAIAGAATAGASPVDRLAACSAVSSRLASRMIGSSGSPYG